MIKKYRYAKRIRPNGSIIDFYRWDGSWDGNGMQFLRWISSFKKGNISKIKWTGNTIECTVKFNEMINGFDIPGSTFARVEEISYDDIQSEMLFAAI